MVSALPYMLGAALLATLGVLFAGVLSFAINGEANRKHATKLMAARVILQGIAVALFALTVLFSVH